MVGHQGRAAHRCMGGASSSRKDHVPALIPEELHVRAQRLWHAEGSFDPAAEQFSAAVSRALASQPVPQRRAMNWILSLHRYEEHWRRFGRTPRENTRAKATLPDDERNLGEWARYQRRFEGRLNAYQRARLDVSPAFDWDPLEHAWTLKFVACERFMTATGVLPRLHAADRSEFVLARWLGRQLFRLQSGRLEENRANAIHRLLRGGRRPQPER